MENNTKANRLIHEKSPYLLQHAYNPVNWYPWGEEAFNKANNENKPIFLSIGYSTCHWCHVMAHESFEDEQVAQVINDGFVPIKIDREERPDIDAVYMSVCQALTGQGGWPLTLLLTPQQKPFYAGTYLPKESRYGIAGLMDLLGEVSKMWKNDRDKLLHSSEKITNALSNFQRSDSNTQPHKDLLQRAFSQLKDGFDEQYGGFGTSPKFPTPHNLMFLLRYYAYEKDVSSLSMVEKTLEQMYRGGIFDHIGFGFSRYSTDRIWLAPHFEKMLYDNALLTIAYLEAFQITKKPLYKDVAVKILEYVTREMTSPQGGFYSAQDADSDGEEGKYYLFTPQEIRTVLGDNDGNDFNQFFDITDEGNFEGKNIANLIDNADFENGIIKANAVRAKLLDYRSKRALLHKDTKVLTSWNALMITAFAKAYRVLGDDAYLQVAQRALAFVQDKLSNQEGRLFIRYSDEDTSGEGIVDDYAFLSWALIELYEATYHMPYLQKALLYQQHLLTHFYDNENGGFYMTADDSENLIMRPKETYDGAMPSGNSVAAYNLVKLSRLTGNEELRKASQNQIRFVSGASESYPAGYSFSMIAISTEIYPSQEIVGVVPESKIKELANVMGKGFYPNTTLTVKNADIAPFTKTYTMKGEEETFYLCEGQTCSPPFVGLNELKIKMEERETNGINMER